MKKLITRVPIEGYTKEYKAGLWTGNYVESDKTFYHRITKESNIMTFGDVLRLLFGVIINPITMCYLLGTIEDLPDKTLILFIPIIGINMYIIYNSTMSRFKLR